MLWNWRRLAPWERLFFLMVGMMSAGIIKVGGDHFSQYRFFVPLLPLLACLSVAGWDRLLQRVGALGVRSPMALRAGMVAMVLVAGWLLPYRLNIYQRAIVFFDEVSLARDLSTIGRFFHTKKAPGVSIAVIAAGAVPYYSELPTVDMIGLLDRRPTYILSVEAPYPAATGLVALPQFHQEYRPALEPWGEFTVGYWVRKVP